MSVCTSMMYTSVGGVRIISSEDLRTGTFPPAASWFSIEVGQMCFHASFTRISGTRDFMILTYVYFIL